MIHTRFHRVRGFTLLETLIAFGVLGIGLVMLAAIFPAALVEHRRTIDRSRAMDLATKAEVMLHSRINPRALYVDNVTLANGFDSPWYALPTVNMPDGFTGVQGSWEDGLQTRAYFAALNLTPPGANPIQLFGTDLTTDRVLPRFNEDMDRGRHRLSWQGFYRTMASGTRHFAIAVCRISSSDVFARQDEGLADPFGDPGARMTDLGGNGNHLVRFPAPWRVTVGRKPGSQILTIPNIATVDAATTLAKLAPRGSKLHIHGRSYTNTGGGVLDFPGGRILTVVDTDGRNAVQILEDMSDIEAYDASGEGFRFDVWVFPPHISGGAFSNEPPVIEWKVSL